MRATFSLLPLLCATCGVAHQPESARTVAAYEISLPNQTERDEFLSVLRVAARAEGLHVDASDTDELKRLSEVSPITIHAAVWRGANDEEALASVEDHADHLGRAWIAFSQGEDPTLATRFRQRAMNKIFERWPATRSLPVMPTGVIPLSRDLRLTPDGYRVAPDAAAGYDLPPHSPLLARD
jgi:hypothetical protein